MKIHLYRGLLASACFTWRAHICYYGRFEANYHLVLKLNIVQHTRWNVPAQECIMRDLKERVCL